MHRHLRAMERIPPVLWEAYARAGLERDALGHWPGPRRIVQIASGTGCCPWALLALTRRQLPELTDDGKELTGRLQSIGHGATGHRPVVLIPSAATYLTLAFLGPGLARQIRFRDSFGRARRRKEWILAAEMWGRDEPSLAAPDPLTVSGEE